jgi:hypothetical protein
MGIVSYHVRIGESLLEALQANPDLFWELPECAAPAGVQQLYIDKDWSALSWLLSAKAREEQKHDVVVFAVSDSAEGENIPSDRDAWNAAKAREASRRGIQLVNTESMPDEPALIAIEGRGPRDERFQQIGYGARTFVPHEVRRLSAALDQLTDADLREHFNPEVMESLDVAGILWTEEAPDVLDAILIPIFMRLKEFYRLAAQAGQHVLVVHA